MMDTRVEDLLHCEEQLKTTLHCNDKDKLRRKLAQLQREYLRTAQRLQRAEHLETVRKHVRSRITQQQHRDTEPSCDPPADTTNQSRASALSEPQTHTITNDKDCGNPRRRQVIQFLLPSDAACPQTPDPDHVTLKGHRPSPSLRLRSRRSRLRWERRSATEGSGISDAGRSQEPIETVGTGEGEDANVSEELFSGSDSDSPSLLLTHWSSQGHGAKGNGHVVESEGIKSEKEADLTTLGEKESTSLLTKCASPFRTIEERHNNSTCSGREEECEKQTHCLKGREKEFTICEKNTVSNTDNNIAEKIEDTYSRHEAHIEKTNEGVSEGKKGVLDSCTLVEGLLFPVEYYVRTTRRMSSSLSQPDMQAVILSQLSSGRQRRGRGRGLTRSISDSWADVPTHPMEASSDYSQRSSEDSGSVLTCRNDSDAAFASLLEAAQPLRGQRRKGRRGRGRPPSQRSTFHQPLPSQELLPSLSLVVTVPAPVDTNLPSNHGNDSQFSPGLSDTPSSSGSKQAEKVYPLFMKSNTKADASSQRSRGAPNHRSLPFSPLLPPPSSSPTALLSALMNSGVQQDFHLPDDQFASLKLHKLRQVAMESGFESFSSPSANTHNSYQRSHGYDPVTPTVTSSPHVKYKQQPTDLQNVVMESNVTDLMSKRGETSKEPQTEVNSSSPVCFDSCKGDTAVSLSNTHKDEPWFSSSHPLKELLATNQSDCQRVENQKSEDLHDEMLSFFSIPEETTKDPPAVKVTSPVESPMERPNRKSSPDAPHLDREAEAATEQVLHGVPTQLFLSSSQALASCVILPSSTPNASPALPSLGLTPHVGHPSLSLPPPHSPTTQDLPPPALSACLSTSYVSPRIHPASVMDHIRISSEPTGGDGQCQGLEPAASLSPTNLLLQDTEAQITQREEETRTNHMRMKTTRLKAAAGGPLVDACYVLDSCGSLCVAAAGKWAVCLWSQNSASEWSLIHTWNFDEPVINVFPVPDAAGLMCVTLGQLEIRAVRTLCCSSLTQTLLCEGVTQAAVGVSESRVVTSSPSASGSTLQVFVLSDSSR
uniref:Partner and localiser of BRCA2 WD40 domain-containing protein n=1 Tax=Gouania willdenowi TaxID=441366 RepID=A0A8C5D5V0_GOUWI